MPNIDHLDDLHTCHDKCPCHWIKELEDFLETLNQDFYPTTIQYGREIIRMARERLR